ncbi:VUT family protein [Vibrio sp. S4M6]|uniref:VUT family protein n=1 Tax=Vibrio sinus TaxID=2946865 RepID=UPI002029D35F|nr:VUT family protein [Vibrio sinus]MCL9782909.1 VUT family protein [Vibrio sinus]
MRQLKLVMVKDDKIHYTNESASLTLAEDADALIDKELIKLFDKKDRNTIRAVSRRHNPKNELQRMKWYGFMTALYIGFLLIAIPMSPHTVSIFGTFQPAGILIFPLTFAMLDVINATLRYEYAKMTVYIGATVCALASLMIFISFHVLNIGGEYYNVFHPLIKLYLINMICVLTSDQLNNFVFRKLNDKFYNKKLWLKTLASSIVGQIAYTIIWILAFFNTSANSTLIHKIIDNYSFKIGYAVVLIPVTYLLVYIFNTIVDKNLSASPAEQG